jgi:hypothetical protein
VNSYRLDFRDLLELTGPIEISGLKLDAHVECSLTMLANPQTGARACSEIDSIEIRELYLVHDTLGNITLDQSQFRAQFYQLVEQFERLVEARALALAASHPIEDWTLIEINVAKRDRMDADEL